MSMFNQKRPTSAYVKYLLLALLGLVFACGLIVMTQNQQTSTVSTVSSSQSSEQVVQTASSQTPEGYQVSDEETAYLKERFAKLSAINPEVIGYIYIPGTKLDEPVVQTGDNATYLEKTFEGTYEPYMGAVFMDTNNQKDFTDSLTWLFGHARGSLVSDNRMFNDVNFYDDQTFFDQNPYLVLETPERNYYYEATYFIIVPETTPLYRTSFESKEDFRKQLETVAAESKVKKADAVIDPLDKYLVLSTCREEDGSLRANLYLRQIPDEDLPQFLAENGDKLTYVATR
ncbi:class B sortase [Streptococcus sp. sy010]|nr:class B sortase [Streptococcus sp. sy010]